MSDTLPSNRQSTVSLLTRLGAKDPGKVNGLKWNINYYMGCRLYNKGIKSSQPSTGHVVPMHLSSFIREWCPTGTLQNICATHWVFQHSLLFSM